jgi:hypothetical protein
MELIWNEISIDRIAGGSVSQALAEGNVPAPEGRNIASVLDAQGSVDLTSFEVVPGHVNIEGAVHVEFICTDGDANVYAFTSSAPFKHSLAIEEAKPGMRANLTAVVQTLNATPNSSQIALEAVADISCRLEDPVPMRVMAGLSGVGDLEMKTERVEYTRRADAGGGLIRVREDIAAAGINAVLTASGEAMIRSIELENGDACVSGTLTVSALCVDSGGRLSQVVQHIPFEELVAIESASMMPSGRVSVQSISVRTVGAEFGILSVESIINVELFTPQRSSVTLTLDAYSPSLPFRPATQRVRFMLQGPGASGKQTLRESVEVPEGLPDIYRPLYSSARPMVTSCSCGDGKLDVEGILFTRIIYQTDGGTLYSFTEDIPFFAQMDAECTAMCDADAKVRCTASIGGGTGHAADVNYTLYIDAEVYRAYETEVVTGIEECAPPDAPKGIIICFAEEGETLYDIAKRFNISRESLREANPQLKDTITPGQRLVLLV